MSDKSPDAFRTISEVADWLGVQPHVLRFWESKFSQVRPVKRAGGRRYYRPNDMLLLGGIRKLLHEDGLTIKGAQKVLREEGMSHVARLSRPLDAESAALSGMDAGFEEDVTDGEPDEVAEPSVQLEPLPEAEPPPDIAPVPQPASPEPPDDAGAEPSQVPSFMRRSETQKPPEPEPQATPHEAPSPEPDRLPSFLQPQKPDEEPSAPADQPAESPLAEREAELPLSFPAAEEPESAPDPGAAPRPNIVDAPDPDESTFQVTPGALSAAVSLTSISPQRRAEILPLIAQLAALRDRMAAARDR